MRLNYIQPHLISLNVYEYFVKVEGNTLNYYRIGIL